jgi:ABC-type sugar transport system permease subunit
MMKRKRSRFGQDRIGYALIAPFYIFFTIFIVTPILMNLALSFTRFDLTHISFIGFKNYVYLIEDNFFFKALSNTAVYTFFTLIFTMGLSLIAAVFLNERIYLQKAYRTIFFLPHITSMAAVAMVWLWMYEPAQGAFNRVLTLVGIPKLNWLHDAKTALPSLIVMSVWKYLGYNMVIYLAGLQTIPEYLYEAATIDGANSVQKFLRITVPMLRPVTFFLFVTGLINNFNVFEQVIIMTDGGPLNSTTTIVHQVYIRAFYDFFMGYASAMAFVSVIIIGAITFFNFRLGSRGVDLEVG